MTLVIEGLLARRMRANTNRDSYLGKAKTPYVVCASKTEVAMRNVTLYNAPANSKRNYWRAVMVCGIPDFDHPENTRFPVAEIEGWDERCTAEEIGHELIERRWWSTYLFWRWLLDRWPTACWTAISPRGRRFRGQESGYFYTAYSWRDLSAELARSSFSARAIHHLQRLERIGLICVNRIGDEVRWIEPRRP